MKWGRAACGDVLACGDTVTGTLLRDDGVRTCPIVNESGQDERGKCEAWRELFTVAVDGFAMDVEDDRNVVVPREGQTEHGDRRLQTRYVI